jgi:hypothetical protein
MSTRIRTIVIALALAVPALSSQAADQSAYFDQQRQITDGYYPVEDAQPAPDRAETPHQAAEEKWLASQIAVGSTSFAPIPFPVPSAAPQATKLKPATSHQAAEDNWLAAERNEESGNVAPVPFTGPKR